MNAFSIAVLLFLSAFLLVHCAVVGIRELRSARMSSPLCLFSGLFAIHFAVPGLLIALSPDLLVIEQNEPYVMQAQFFAVCCFVTIHIMAGILRRRELRSGQPAASVTAWNDRRIFWICVILFLLGWVDRAYVVANDGYLQLHRAVQGQLEGPFYAAIRMIEMFPQTVLIICLIQWLATPDSSIKRLVWLRAVVLMWITEFVYWLPTGRKEEVVLLLVLPLIIYNMMTGLQPKRRNFLIAAGFIVLLFPLSYFYRATWSESSLSGASITDVIRESASEVQHRNYDSNLSSGQIIFNRLSLIEPAASCIRLIDEGAWSRFNGSSYFEALFGLIPRILWPSKPDLHYGTTFGQDAGYISSNDNVTSISVTYVGEAYLNFGAFGFLAFALIFTLYSTMFDKARVGNHRTTWAFLYAATLPVLLYFGGTFALYFGGLIKVLPVYYVLGRFAERPRAVRADLVLT